MIRYTEESFEELYPLVQEYVQAHWEEVSSLPEFAPDVDVDLFTALQNSGALLCFAAWDGDKLIGYVADFVKNHPHYKTVKVAQCDVYFIDPKYRAKCAIGLTKFVEKVEKEIGIYSRITRSKKANNAGAFFKAMGYDEAEIAWMKRL